MSENPASDSFMNDHSGEANELFVSGSDHHQDYTRHPWSEGPIDYHNENEPNANNIPGISGDFNFTSGEESNVMTSDIDNFSVSNNSPAREMTSNVNNTSNISPNSSVGSNIAAPSVDASHEESAGTNNSLGNESYFDQPINQLTLNDRAYFANYYPYITPQSNLPGGNQTTLNNGTYTLTLPAATNNPVRIDPSLLNYEQNVPVQGSSNYGQTGYVNNPVSVNSNPVANYWNEDVHAQISRGLPSNYYSTIPTTTSYEQFVLNSNGRSIVADPMRDYITLGDSSLTNKGKKKRGRKPESDYTHVIPLPSPSSTDGNRQEIAQCSNCGVRDTPAWRRDLQGVALLCNACGLYLKNKGVYRPTEIAPDGTVRLMRTQRPEPEFACHNCGTRNTPCWRGPEGQKLCNKCGLFLKQHGYARPPSSPHKSVRYNSY